MAKKGSATVDSKPAGPNTTITGEIENGQASAAATSNEKYMVVARRYRPKTFAELVGQSTVSQALLSAIQSNRVGHAYLFTGARGVGKTSTARIFAKALNAAAETNGVFDPNSDISLAIDAGEDMDVLEIDGASNRGIDEIRQLRSNAAVRPSRSRYKIYIIDEVHMLTTQAFNALLKTLEEPPGHVKFIFCTTDPEKIPITVLSRCQRFDFPPVHADQIFDRLKFICESEGTNADEAALRLIARRATGSMRDSQSLLEQLLSFSGNHITVEIVHDMLGTADETRLAAFATRLIERDAAGALRELNSAAEEGVDVGQLAEQLLGYLRDMMTVTVGGSADLIRTANPSSVEQLQVWGKSWGTMTLLSALQLLDEAIVKMRYSVQSRILLEIALVQICNLQDLQALSDLVKALSTQSAPPPRTVANVAPPTSLALEPKLIPEAKKKVEPSSLNDAADIQPAVMAAATVDLDGQKIEHEETPVEANTDAIDVSIDNQTIESLLQDTSVAPEDYLPLLREVAATLGGLAGQCSMMAVRIEYASDLHWKICLSQEGAMALNYFQSGDNGRRLAQSFSNRIGRNLHFEFLVTQEPTLHFVPADVVPTAEPLAIDHSPTPPVPQSQLIRNAMNHPLIKQFMEVFEGQVVRVDPAQPHMPIPHFDSVMPSIPQPKEFRLGEKPRTEIAFETTSAD